MVRENVSCVFISCKFILNAAYCVVITDGVIYSQVH